MNTRQIILILALAAVFLAGCGSKSDAPLGVTVSDAVYTLDDEGQPCFCVTVRQKGGFPELPVKSGYESTGVKLILRCEGLYDGEWRELEALGLNSRDPVIQENTETQMRFYCTYYGLDLHFEPEEGVPYRLKPEIWVTYDYPYPEILYGLKLRPDVYELPKLNLRIEAAN